MTLLCTIWLSFECWSWLSASALSEEFGESKSGWRLCRDFPSKLIHHACSACLRCFRWLTFDETTPTVMKTKVVNCTPTQCAGCCWLYRRPFCMCMMRCEQFEVDRRVVWPAVGVGVTCARKIAQWTTGQVDILLLIMCVDSWLTECTRWLMRGYRVLACLCWSLIRIGN